MGQQHHHHHPLSFHLPHMGKKDSVVAAAEGGLPPKGCMAVRVGGEGEKQQRFVVPVMYLKHPLFGRLLKEAEEEYGFDQKGAVTIPCHVGYFRQVQGIIEGEMGGGGEGHVSSDHHHHHHHHNLLAGCFRA